MADQYQTVNDIITERDALRARVAELEAKLKVAEEALLTIRATNMAKMSDFTLEDQCESMQEWAEAALAKIKGGVMICPKCGGQMKLSKAIAQTFTGTPEFPGDTIVTMSAGGPGKLIDCLKCEKCGHSVSTGKEAS